MAIHWTAWAITVGVLLGVVLVVVAILMVLNYWQWRLGRERGDECAQDPFLPPDLFTLGPLVPLEPLRSN